MLDAIEREKRLHIDAIERERRLHIKCCRESM